MKNQLLALITKYKYFLIYIILFSFISFVFNPKQKEYYFRKDIEGFSKNTYINIVMILTVILILTTIIYGLFKKFKAIQIINSVLFTGFFSFTIFFLMRLTCTSLCLYLNRQVQLSQNNLQYTILNITDNKYLTAYNVSNENDFIDEDDFYKYDKAKNILNLKRNDTLTFKMSKGLLGINYFRDK